MSASSAWRAFSSSSRARRGDAGRLDPAGALDPPERLPGLRRRLARAQRLTCGCALSLLTMASALAQSYRDVAPVAPPAAPRPTPAPPALPAVSDDHAQALPNLKGLRFVAAAAPAAGAARQSHRPALCEHDVCADDLPFLDGAFLSQFAGDIGHPLTFGRLAEIRRAVIVRYRDSGEPLVDVFVPEQDVSDGIVRVAVAQYTLGEVRVRGNRYFSSRLLESEMPVVPGATVKSSAVASGLDMLNANPYRTVDVIYTPGKKPDTTDMVLQTEDRLPLRFSAGLDNSGVPQLGRDRLFAGFDYGNLFGLDQQIGYQFTASDDLVSGNPNIEGRSNRARFLAHSFSYSAPLPWQDRIALFGIFAQSTPRLPDSYGQNGISAQISLRYDLRMPPLGAWIQKVQLGYDFKRSNNDLEFGGLQVFNANTHIHQFLLAYDVQRNDASGLAHGNVSVIGSPGGLDAENHDSDFQQSRLGATARYTYVQIQGDRTLALGAGFSLSAHGVFQWTPDTLLPSETLGLGGDSSVRGYDPYVVLGDRGWNIQTEIRTPALPFGGTGAAMQPFVFTDAGRVWNRIDQPSEPSNGALVSVGGGVRFQIRRYVNLRALIGFPLRAAVPAGSKAPLGMVYLVMGN